MAGYLRYAQHQMQVPGGMQTALLVALGNPIAPAATLGQPYGPMMSLYTTSFILFALFVVSCSLSRETPASHRSSATTINRHAVMAFRWDPPGDRVPWAGATATTAKRAGSPCGDGEVVEVGGLSHACLVRCQGLGGARGQSQPDRRDSRSGLGN